MKRHLIKLGAVITLIAIVGALVFTGCTEEEEPPPPPPPPPVEEEEEPPPPPPVVEEWEWPDKLALMCGTGVGQASTIGWSAPLAADTGITIRVVPEVNPMLRFKWVKSGLFHSVAESPSMVADLMEAKAGNAVRDGGPFQIRLMWSYSMSNSGFVVRGDSDIYEPTDIKPGVKFVDFAFFPGFIEGFPSALMAWAGVDIDDVEWVPVGSYGAAMRAVSDGKADISMAFNTSPATVEAAAAPHGIRFINLPADEDPEGARRFLEFYPVISFGEATQGPPEAIAGVTTTLANTGIYVRADADPDLIYHLAKWLDENYDLYKDNHAWNQYMTIDTLMDLTETCFIPVHDGLKKYLNEKGLWTAAHEARQQQNIDLITQYVEAYQAAKDEADDTGIAVDPTTEEWLELWASYKADIPRFSMFLGLEE